MKRLLEDLFPIYRTLCGPGALETLERIQQEIPLKIHEYPSGEKAFDWTIPKEFIVRKAHILNSLGETIADFKDHPYHLWIYSQPFEGSMNLTELKRHLASDPENPESIPLRQCYYREDWGFSVTHDVYESLKEDMYSVVVDVEHRDGVLRIGEAYLEGETKQEILINSYICHPLGANDNLSGTVASVELYKRLAQIPSRRFSIRLCLWPETIGPIVWLAKHCLVGDKRRFYPQTWKSLNPVLAALTIGICGDCMYSPSDVLKLDNTPSGETPIDRAFLHVGDFHDRYEFKDGPLKKKQRWPWTFGVYERDYSGFMNATDSRHFNLAGIPSVTLTRGGPCNYPEYHSSLDTPDIIDWEHMEETVEVAYRAIQVLERNRVYKPRYDTTPCLSAHSIFPYQHGTGKGGRERTDQARAYFELMYLVDGKRDLLSIADSQGMSIFDFDEPVEKFLEKGLIVEAD